jgi:hypothetical protein
VRASVCAVNVSECELFQDVGRFGYHFMSTNKQLPTFRRAAMLSPSGPSSRCVISLREFKLRIATVSFVMSVRPHGTARLALTYSDCQLRHVCPSARNSSARTGQISINFRS